MPEFSVNPAGERFPLPEPSEYAQELRRLRRGTAGGEHVR